MEEGEVEHLAGASGQDVDLVRLYLTHIGKRKLLKPEQEREIGLRIEQARGGVIAALAVIPAAVGTFASLARTGEDGRARPPRSSFCCRMAASSSRTRCSR